MRVYQSKYLVHIIGHFLSTSLPYELFRLPAGSTRTMSHKLLLSERFHSESSVTMGILMKNLVFMKCAKNRSCRSQLPRGLRCGSETALFLIDCVWNVMAYKPKPDFIFRRNVRVHLNRQGHQFIRLLAAELCASTVVMLDTPRSEVVWRVLDTHSVRQFPLQFPSHASPCAITFQLGRTAGLNPAGDIIVFCESCVWSGGGLCDGSITRPEESNQA